MTFPTPLLLLLQAAALLLSGLVAGSVFGLWAGFNLTLYTPAAFLEAHQGAVRGLNVLLPVLGGLCLALAVILAVSARGRPAAPGLHVGAAVAFAIAGLVTRLVNQPINGQVMTWTLASLPADWEAIRATWWSGHVARLAASVLGQLALIAAVLVQRG